MIFYDGGTNDAVTGPGGGVKAPKKWPDNFVNDTSSTYNNWHGASRETGITVVPWNTFIENIERALNSALRSKMNTPSHAVVKTV